MLDKDRLIELCGKYRLSYNYFGDKVLITTGTDQWLIVGKLVGSYSEDEYSDLVFELRHKNKNGNKTGKICFHKQRTVSKLEHAFDTIIEHRPQINDYQKTIDLIKQLEVKAS